MWFIFKINRYLYKKVFMEKKLLSLSDKEKSRILEMHYRASGKNLISENVEDYFKDSTQMNSNGILIESFGIDEQTKLDRKSVV